MKYIYNCFGGSHSSVTTAGIHLGLLPRERAAENKELLALPYYDAQVAKDHGRLRFMGFDELGNEVYVTGSRNLRTGYERIMRSVLTITGTKQKDIVIINTMPYVNLWMMIGGYLSRRLGFFRVGRSIILYGTRCSYYKFIHLVNLIKMQ